MRDGSVRRDVDIKVAVNDISAAVFGVAYAWIVLPEQFELGRELTNARRRIVSDYGARRKG